MTAQPQPPVATKVLEDRDRAFRDWLRAEFGDADMIAMHEGSDSAKARAQAFEHVIDEFDRRYVYGTAATEPQP